MKYEVHISGRPSGKAEPAQDRAPEPPRRGQGPRAHKGPAPVVHRFPPVLQFLTLPVAHVEQQLQAICLQAYHRGGNLGQICHEIHEYARSLGFEAVMGVQEVYSASMPSFAGQTVMSALIMVDLRPVAADHGPHPRPFNRAI